MLTPLDFLLLSSAQNCTMSAIVGQEVKITELNYHEQMFRRLAEIHVNLDNIRMYAKILGTQVVDQEVRTRTIQWMQCKTWAEFEVLSHRVMYCVARMEQLSYAMRSQLFQRFEEMHHAVRCMESAISKSLSDEDLNRMPNMWFDLAGKVITDPAPTVSPTVEHSGTKGDTKGDTKLATPALVTAIAPAPTPAQQPQPVAKAKPGRRMVRRFAYKVEPAQSSASTKATVSHSAPFALNLPELLLAD